MEPSFPTTSKDLQTMEPSLPKPTQPPQKNPKGWGRPELLFLSGPPGEKSSGREGGPAP